MKGTIAMTLPTQSEIVARLRERRANDMFGFETNDYLEWLDFEHAKEFLKPEATVDQWPAKLLTRDAIISTMREYMPFAWGKANDFRGLSAGRSVSHYTAWTWLAGERELSEFCDDETNYEHYGKEILAKVCEHFGWDSKQWDDGVRLNNEP